MPASAKRASTSSGSLEEANDISVRGMTSCIRPDNIQKRNAGAQEVCLTSGSIMV